MRIVAGSTAEYFLRIVRIFFAFNRVSFERMLSRNDAAFVTHQAGFIKVTFYGSDEYDYPDTIRSLSPESAFALCAAHKK